MKILKLPLTDSYFIIAFEGRSWEQLGILSRNAIPDNNIKIKIFNKLRGQ